MLERFFLPAVGPSETTQITGAEAHHLARVRRIRRGESVQIFDGSGLECEAVVRDISREAVTIEIVRRDWVSRELSFSLTLACAVAKGDRLRWLVEKATELGVSSLVPILTQHSPERAHHLQPDRMHRWVVEACKQCRRNLLMSIEPPVEWCAFATSRPTAGVKLLADPTGIALSSVNQSQRSLGCFLAVGPEGGFTADELQIARATGWTAVNLGARILRVETAALVLAARVAQEG